MPIGYARVSTDVQSTRLQRDALERAGCDRLFEEAASGARADREELAAAMAYAREGDTIIVWKLDRLARSLAQLIDTVAKLEARKIGLRSLTEAIDTTTPGGRLVFHIFGALAEFERSLIRERTHAGLAAARARGRIGGRKKSLSSQDIALARTLLANPNIPVIEIARKLGVSEATFYRWLPGGRSAAVSRP